MRVIIVQTLEQAKDALQTAEASGENVAIQSAPDMIFYAGSLYILKMFEQAQAAFPKVAAQFILDAGDAGAQTISAMQMGHKIIRSTAPAPIKEKLKTIAAAHGVELL